MDKKFISVPSTQVILDKEFDVLVAGGGIAGIAAALSASRAGAKVLLVEPQYALGGLATLGLVTIYLALCDGYGQQVSFGIAEELYQLALSIDDERVKQKNWKRLVAGNPDPKLPRYETTYNPSTFSILAEQLLMENGVEIRYGVQVCDTIVEDGVIKAVITQGRFGRKGIPVKSVVDATGDAIVCELSGAKTVQFQQKNILAAWYYAFGKNAFSLHPLGACDVPDKHKSEEEQNISQTRYLGLSDEELSQFTVDAHRALLEDFLRDGSLNKDHQLGIIPSIPQIRMTRRLAGKAELQEPDGIVHYTDSIGLISNWRRRGPVYEIPFSCLYGEEVRNLITAGRCISTEEAMWDLTRVIPACAVTGEAAGLAAAISSDFTTLEVQKLQSLLQERGIPLEIEK